VKKLAHGFRLAGQIAGAFQLLGDGFLIFAQPITAGIDQSRQTGALTGQFGHVAPGLLLLGSDSVAQTCQILQIGHDHINLHPQFG
jgi:hypothetical protein